MQAQGIPSYFRALLHNLSFQSFKEFELIYVDTLYEFNREHHQALIESASFQVKHVPIHVHHRYWYDKGYCFISAAKNTGIVYADGELVVSCDDAEFLPDYLLKAYWNHYQTGRFMHAVHKRLKNIKTTDGLPVMPIDGDVYINDHRLTSDNFLGNQTVVPHRYGTLTFAGTSYSLADALHLNGFNERMDSSKSLEDCDFGIRMVMIGRELVMDRDGFLYILDHPSYADAINVNWAEPDKHTDIQVTNLEPHKQPYTRKIENLIAVENYGVLCCAKELVEPQANKYPLTERHLEIIQRETIKYRGFDPLAPENKEKFDLWKQTPMFDLKQQREETRNSPDWIWK